MSVVILIFSNEKIEAQKVSVSQDLIANEQRKAVLSDLKAHVLLYILCHLFFILLESVKIYTMQSVNITYVFPEYVSLQRIPSVLCGNIVNVII